MITAVVCDFGGVLTTPLADAFAAVNEHLDLPVTALAEALAAGAQQRGTNPLFDLETGVLPEPEFLANVQQHVCSILGRDVDLSDFSEIFWRHLLPNHELIELMSSLRATHRLAMLTNNVREWGTRWRAMIDADAMFELIVDSSVVGIRKPDRGIYDALLEQLALPAEECLLVDDFEVNCVAARELGMHAVQFHDNAQAIPEVHRVLAAHRG